MWGNVLTLIDYRSFLELTSKKKETSRERPKSAPYPCSKIAKGLQSVKYSLLQYPCEEKIETKFRFFLKFSFDFFVSGKSHSAENCKRGPLGVFEHPFFCKIGKNEGGPFGDNNQKSLTMPKKNQHKNFLVMLGLEPTSFCLADLKKA